jgi:hypothetical protein
MAHEWRAQRFDAGSPALTELLASGRVREVHDTLLDQLRELVACREAAREETSEEQTARAIAHLAGTPPECHGAWFFYPWSARLVHVLPPDELRQVRTDRNRYKITAEEQERLRGARVGVVGLSVGNAVAVTCALEGIGSRFRIADFDTLSLSNLNRLRAGVHELGLPKTVVAARQMLEVDPYLEIEPYPAGITRDNVDAFLLEGGRLDLLIEECDDLFVKVMVRERARLHRIPVLMETCDRGLLDVERFDREPERPILHGLIGDVAAERLRGLPTREKVPYVLAILDGERMSARMAASLPEVKESLSSWPQLASSVAVGGGVAADLARRILLDQHTESGRYYVDVEAIVRDGAGALRQASPPPPPVEIAPEALAPPQLPARPARPRELTTQAVRWLVAHGTLAPSAHNAQPWRFHFDRSSGVLACEHDPSHDLPTLDFEHGATWVAFGAFLENLELAASAIGLEPRCEPFPDRAQPRLVCRVRFAPRVVEEPPLLPWIARRVTNRRRGPRAALAEESARALALAAEERGARLQLLTGPAALDEIGALVGACDRLTAFNRDIHHETMSGLRWTRSAVESRRDGIDLTTLELSDADRAGMQLLSSWPTMKTLGELGGGRVLEDAARKQIAAASAVGLVTVAGVARESHLAGGRAVERVWLTATSAGLALQPMTSLPYLFARLERGGGHGLSDGERARLAALLPRYRHLFATPAGHAEVLLFRVGVANPPTARALRRRLDDVLTLS